jgi:hypothetical protein
MRGHGDGERYRGWRVEKDEEERRTVGEIEELVDDALVGVVDTFRGEDEGDETTVARDCDGRDQLGLGVRRLIGSQTYLGERRWSSPLQLVR